MKGRRAPIAIVSTLLSLFTFSQFYQRSLFEKLTPYSERLDEKQWVASSHSWLDRKACNWFGFCGLAHLNKAGWVGHNVKASRKQQAPVVDADDLSSFWTSGKSRPEDWSDDERVLREVPQYVLEYAPYVYLYSGEQFWPSDIAEHLIHTTPHLNYTPLQAKSDHPTLTNLDELNAWGRFVYLQSDDNVEERPEWLGSAINIPNRPGDPDEQAQPWAEWDGRIDGEVPNDEREKWYDVGIGSTRDQGGIRPAPKSGGESSKVPVETPEGEELVDDEDEDESEDLRPEALRRRGKRTVGGRSDAPAVLVVVDKGEGVVDAFWFFFYSYNLGNVVLNVRFGNHVGDWEHTVIRFHNGKPKAVFFSEHNFGDAYSYEAVEKIGKRPVAYSATGTHAMYATAGTHPYVLPGGLLHDVTDRGPLWDPLLNSHAYTYDYVNDTLRSSNVTPLAPTEWFYFIGHWGDKFYPLDDPRQYRFVGQYHYVNGPLGPRFKNLGRTRICQGNNECLVKSYIGPSDNRRLKRFEGVGEGEEMSEEDVKRFVGPEELEHET
ncbi:uncharacterized protein BDZ99DRAFT_391235 [Mytilinidion resinicola]|uniref:Vacuolar protein sorting-associated protein TDA6 n=1 Tax=Mytilinidion resinicola TaxID=574789 RepID=A0A6A6YFQ0_9PEZI|nr:uncharacterized protein BDZ99DRAFT_391235 [Mytilinidion resinicola]KAF2807622.1 hypothetical protein BDZ99DRAFT_391235 [Mytilinidion resinicola]